MVAKEPARSSGSDVTNTGFAHVRDGGVVVVDPVVVVVRVVVVGS